MGGQSPVITLGPVIDCRYRINSSSLILTHMSPNIASFTAADIIRSPKLCFDILPGHTNRDLPVQETAFVRSLIKLLDWLHLGGAGAVDSSKNNSGTMRARHTREYDLHTSQGLEQKGGGDHLLRIGEVIAGHSPSRPGTMAFLEIRLRSAAMSRVRHVRSGPSDWSASYDITTAGSCSTILDK
jgi:hypothetical protein